MKNFEGLERGDIVRSKDGTRRFIVTSNYGKRVTAISSVDMTNPEEWEKYCKEHKEYQCSCFNCEIELVLCKDCGSAGIESEYRPSKAGKFSSNRFFFVRCSYCPRQIVAVRDPDAARKAWNEEK